VSWYSVPRGQTHIKSPPKLRLPVRIGLVVLLAVAHVTAWAHPSVSELVKWTDQRMTVAIAEQRALGIAVAIVSDGRIAYLQGYGRADANRAGIVDPRVTLFSIGSLAKNFTATAIEQLREARRIRSLDDPVNIYLRRAKLPGAMGARVTIENLLDHRGGFDESVYGLATTTDIPVPITSAQIRQRLPPIIRPPGEISVYSNIGYGVLGLVIEDVSGETYGGYISAHILAPLQMTHSFVRYRPTDPISTPGTMRSDGQIAPIPQNWAYHPFIAPSAAVVSTAEDMSKFMLGQMLAERGEVPTLVSAEGAHRLHDRHTANSPATTGFGMSFFAHTWNGERVAENAGSGPGFQAPMILIPDLGVGFIALISGDSSTRLRSLNMFEVREDFLNFFLGPLEPTHGPPYDLPLSRFTGLYRNERRPHSSDEALLEPGTTLWVQSDGANGLTINGRAGYRQIAPGVFWRRGVVPFVPDESSSDLFAFILDRDQHVQGVVPFLGMDIYRPARIAPDTNRLICAVLILLCGTGGAAGFWRHAVPLGRWARRFLVAIGCTAIAGIAALAIEVGTSGNPVFALAFGNLSIEITAAVFANFLVVLTVISTPILLGAHWRTSAKGWGVAIARVHTGLVWISGIGLIPAFMYVKLLGYYVPCIE